MILLDFFYQIYLKFLVWIVSKTINSRCDVICIQGSLANKNVKFLISDIDLLIVTKYKNKISSFFERLNLLPFLHFDVDIYDREEISFLLKFGSLKFYRFNYHFIKGKLDQDYYFYPLKFHIDILHSIFQSFEWINKIANTNTLFRRKRILRLIDKINKDLVLLNCKPISHNHVFHSILRDLSNSLKECQGINKIHNLDISIVENIFEKDNLISFDNLNWIKVDGEYHSGHYLVLDEYLFEVFKKSGCFSLDYLFRFDLNSRNRLGAKFLELSGLGYYITGKNSWVIEVERKLTRDSLLKSSYLDSIYSLVVDNFPKVSDCLSLLNRNVYINVFWGNDSKRQEVLKRARNKIKKQNGDFLHFTLNLSFQDSPSFEIIDDQLLMTIKGNPNNYDLWHKEALFNIAGFFLWGADTLIFADSDIYSHDKDWLNKIIDKTSNYDFVQGFSNVIDTVDEGYNAQSWVKKYLEGESYFRAPGLIWGMKFAVFNKIDGLPDDFPEGSGDGALVRELTGEKLSFIDYYPWFTNNLRNYVNQFTLNYVDVEVVHINHGRARDYVNRSIFLNLVDIDFKKVIDKDDFGLLSWKTDNHYLTAPFKLKDYIFEYSKDKFLFLIKELYQKGILRYLENDRHIFFSKSPHYHELGLRDGGVGFIFDGTGDEIIYHLPEINKPNIIYDMVLSHLKVVDFHSYIKIDLPNMNRFKAIEVNIDGEKLLANFDMLKFENKEINHIHIFLNNFENKDVMVVATGETVTNQEWSTGTTFNCLNYQFDQKHKELVIERGINRINIESLSLSSMKGKLDTFQLISFQGKSMFISFNRNVNDNALVYLGAENYIYSENKMYCNLYKSNKYNRDEIFEA